MNYLASAKDLARFLQIFSGIAGAGAILVCLFKMVTNSDEAQGYTKKIKNILIALVLIFSVTSIINLTQRYVNPNSDSSFLTIGKAPQAPPQILATTTYSDKDSKNREIVFINGAKCVITKKDCNLRYKVDKESGEVKFKVSQNWMSGIGNGISGIFGGWKNSKIKVDELKLYQDTQNSWTKTSITTEPYAYRLSNTDENIYPSNLRYDKDGNCRLFDEIGDDGKIKFNYDNNGKIIVGSKFSTRMGQLVAYLDNGDWVVTKSFRDQIEID